MRTSRSSMSAFALASVILTQAAFARAEARWIKGDTNNPPTQNAPLALNVQNDIVGVTLSYEEPGSIRTGKGTGVIIGMTPDNPKNAKSPGWLCVLTADHVVAAPGDAKNVKRTIAFKAGGASVDLGATQFDVSKFFEQATKKDRVDLAVLGVRIKDVSTLPQLAPLTIGPAVAADQIFQAGFGDSAGVITSGNIAGYDQIKNSYGKLGIGLVDLPAADPGHDFGNINGGLQISYKDDALKGGLSFQKQGDQFVSGTGLFMNGDSGGPTVEMVDKAWRLIGIHSTTSAGVNGFFKAGRTNWWDVDVSKYSDKLIKGWCNSVAPVPEASTILGFGCLLALAGLSAVRLRRHRALVQ